jgi:anti-sigma B factor antagonist
MEVRERTVGMITVVRPVGTLALSEHPCDNVLKDTIGRSMLQGRLQFVLDLGAVSHAETSGLAMLVAVHATVTRRGGQLKLVNLTSRLRELLSVTKLNTVFEIVDTEHEAIESFSREPAPTKPSA